MRAASIHEIKQELSTVPAKQLAELCLRLAKFKKENKELLTYLLFEANDEQAYVAGVKTIIEDLFSEINITQLYFAKKSLRKIVREINKYSRYSASKETEIMLRLHFCELLKASGIPYKRNTVILNLFSAQLKKSTALVLTLHEDLQFEYKRMLENIID